MLFSNAECDAVTWLDTTSSLPAATEHLVQRHAIGGVGHQDSEATLAGMVEAISAMFEGLKIRAIRNPNIDRDVLVRMFRHMVSDLLTQTS